MNGTHEVKEYCISRVFALLLISFLLYHIFNRDQSTAVIENTDTENIHDFVLPYETTMKTENDANIPMTAASRFSLNDQTIDQNVDASHRIIPAPYRTTADVNAISFVVFGIRMVNDGLLGGLQAGASDMLSKLGVNGAGGHDVSFTIGSLPLDIASPEAYTMQVTAQGTTITALDIGGLFHGFMSFIGLLDVANSGRMKLKEMTIHDKPRFEYRGHQVDAARNFRSKEAIKKTIDAMALWKVSCLGTCTYDS